MTPARRSPVATATTAAGPRAASGLRGAAPPKKLRPRAGLGAHVATIAIGRAASDAPVPRRHPCLGTVPPPVPQLPAGAALSPGGAPGLLCDRQAQKQAAAGICGPIGDTVKQRAAPSLPITRSGCQCRRSHLPTASSSRSLTEGDTEYIHCILMEESKGRSRIVQCPLKLQKLEFHVIGRA